MYFHFQQLSKQATTHPSFHPFSPYSAMQALSASRLVSADFPMLVGVLAFQIEQRTSEKRIQTQLFLFVPTCSSHILSSSLVDSSYAC